MTFTNDQKNAVLIACRQKNSLKDKKWFSVLIAVHCLQQKDFVLSISSKYSFAFLSRIQALIQRSSEFPNKVLFCVCKLKAGCGHPLLCYSAGYFFICLKTGNECNYVRTKQVSDFQPLLKKQYKTCVASGLGFSLWMVQDHCFLQMGLSKLRS